jgi:hypothetical protein
MSALGQKQTYAVHNGMSALPPKADIHSVPGALPRGSQFEHTLAGSDPFRVIVVCVAIEREPHRELLLLSAEIFLGPNFGPKLPNTARNTVTLDSLAVLRNR